MSYSTRRQGRDNEYISNTQQREQHEATIRSIDETKNNIHKAIEEVRRETPGYAQSITDFQNETTDATREIADNFLDSQKEVINSMQSAWGPMIQSMQGGRGGQSTGMMGIMMPFFSPIQMANIYARTIGAMTEAYVASTRMATNVLFAGIEATRATTNYARQNAKEASRITSNTTRTFAHTAKETVQVQGGEDQQRGGGGGEISVGGSHSSSSGTEGRGGAAKTRTTHTTEGSTATSGSGTESTTGTTGTVNLSDTVPGITEKEGKK
jgi:hypothetical protein